ncbi:MAG: hypothetical protein MJ097_06840 [Dorea sp.]|nr:hypothetical protein [Dorea sp.]
MKKRLFTLIAVMGLSLALAACGGSKAEEKTEPEKSTAKVSALVLEDENEKKAGDEAEDDGEVLDGTDKDDMEVEMEAEDWSDFKADTVLTPEEEATEDCIEFDREYYEIFRLDFNHKDEVDKIEFYMLLDQDKTVEEDYSEANRSKCDAYFADDDNYDLINEPVFIKYSVPEVVPNLIVRFTSYGGNVREYLCQYNGRDGGANLTEIQTEFTK